MIYSLLCIVCLSARFLSVSGTLFSVGPRNNLEYKNASLGYLVSGKVSRDREEVWLYKYAWKDKIEVFLLYKAFCLFFKEID